MMLLLAFAWAVAEATFWPIMPDALLVPLALSRPQRWWQLVLAAMLGTALGGVVSYRAGRVRPDPSAVAALPLVRPLMVEAGARWLTDEGARGVMRQPASGVPFKVFARLAGSQDIGLRPFLAWAVAARTGRFLASAGGAALLARYAPALSVRWLWPATALWSVAFGVGLWRTVRYWDAPVPPPVVEGDAAGAIQHVMGR
jgi:membrane protein YqaA with SNARE-associated domain